MTKIAVAGLGRMGMQIVQKLAAAGHTTIAQNRSTDKVDTAVSYGAIGVYHKEDVVKHFEGEQVILWLMIPADIVESELNVWLDLIPEGSIIIDGGNTDYSQTRKHAELVRQRGSVLLDIGTSGGIHGLKDGFCMMVGGDRAGYEQIEPFLQTLALPNGGYQYFGEPGSGHYVKMVHNAIEYGMMESLAEGYRMLKEGPYESLDLGAAGELWQHGSIVVSGLNKLSTEALQENPELTGIDGYVAESGEARWTLETAKDLGIEMPSIQASFDVRLRSQQGETNFATKLLAAMRNKFGGHAINKEAGK
ncbi:MAG TPA: NADP-dependent phosphogluconate dehydrogenase [Candidatus Limnocylindrales bacterium]|nr:NADP-dependent phosphogluconate dehydrogenase [Candidatus Limnocylindrales bacterium]